MPLNQDPKYIQVLQDIANEYKVKAKAEADLLSLQLTNAERLLSLQIANTNKLETYQEQQNQKVNEKLIKLGFDANSVISKDDLKQRLANLEKYYKKRISHAKGNRKKELQEELAEKIKNEEKLSKKRKELEDKEKKEEAKRLVQGAQKELANLEVFNFGEMRNVLKEFADNIKTETGKDVGVGGKIGLVMAATVEKLANWTKQLESQIKDIAYAQSEIDTRLQGSGLNKLFGSYWKNINQDIVRSVGMSPMIKQETVLNNLKTLVSKGIAFDVEQRAFLQTISDKIATTFEVADSTLLKLVRIQQADTTAARLGMESALTAFLNNMYETTEYMTDAAASIRSSLYEASALMGGAEATAFEYQVQKWMGSLYSVGFSNAEGLAGALGKLAAGDISAISNGGYGNLLLMAAQRANLSIADILADGLDDSETNRLLQSAVEYLQEIYSETKNNKVVAQQFANVYGLTASDLKAAANLYGSTTVIQKNSMGYTGMMQQLQNMANSMYSRMGAGEMLENLLGNFKFATSSSLANNPVLYTIFTLGNMLKDTTGGIDVPLPLVYGNGLNAKINIADVMLATSLSGGFLQGLGTMIAGLGNGGGFSGGGMLKAFGILNDKMNVITRGNGTGLAALSGNTVSESGSLVGNASGSDVQNATLGGAEEEGNEKVEAAQEEYDDTKLSTVDEHIIQIYDLLQGVVDGTSSFHVDMGNTAAWADILGGGKI